MKKTIEIQKNLITNKFKEIVTQPKHLVYCHIQELEKLYLFLLLDMIFCTNA